MTEIAERGRAVLPRAWSFNPATIVWLGLAVLLAILVLVPIAWLVVESLRSESGQLGVMNYVRVVTSDRYRLPALNSFLLAGSAGVLSVLISAPLAWAIARTDMPLRGLIRVLVFGSMVTPGFLTAMAWIILAGPNAGLINRAYQALTGTNGTLVNIFSMPGMIFVTLLEVFPFAFLLISASLVLISAELEDAAKILGANTWRTMISVTLPLTLPAILGGFILAFLEAFVLFGSPAMIGIPAQTYVLTTQIWSLFQYPVRLGLAAALALPMLLITVCLLWLQRRLLGRRAYVTVTGRSGMPRQIPLGWAKWPVLALSLLVVTVSVLLPYLTLLAYATARTWGAPLGPGNFTLENFAFVLLGHDQAQRALRNSLVLALSAATLASLLAAVTAYIVERRLIQGAQLLAFLAMAPMVIPGIVFAVGLFAAYSRPPLLLYGTLGILLVAYLTKFLPLAFVNAATAIRSVSSELEDAARILGAGQLLTFGDVVLPLIRHGILGAWFLVFIYSFRELSSSILLFTNQTTVIAVTIFDFYETGVWAPLSALGVITLLVNLVVVAVGYRLAGSRFLSTGE